VSKAAAQTVLGFDYGSRYIGIAVGQSVTATAAALETVQVRNGKPDWLRIQKLLEEWQPDAVVVGEPLNMDGTEQAMTVAARRFARQLHGRFGVPVHHVDERLSSVEARAQLAERGQLDRADHPYAAQLLLETWLADASLRACATTQSNVDGH
jgi:putative holliday junction resolvase